jgi:hypothetical protein
VDDLFAAVRLGMRRFWRGGDYVNAPAGESLVLLGRLARILRWAFVILAAHLELAPRTERTAGPSPADRAPAVRLPRPSFPLFARFRIVAAGAPAGAAPAGFAAPRDRVLIAQRKLDALTRALNNPMPFIRRMARRLPTQLMVFGWRPPKRPPPTSRRDFWDELLTAFHEARHVLVDFRRRTRDIPTAASGS